MNGSWALEFVGGPMDGRHDIATPVDLDVYRIATSPPLPVLTPASEIPPTCPEFPLHVWRLSLWRTRQYSGILLERELRIDQDIWLYEGVSDA